MSVGNVGLVNCVVELGYDWNDSVCRSGDMNAKKKTNDAYFERWVGIFQ